MKSALLISLLLLCGSVAQAKPIESTQAVRAILGEAEGEPYRGKVALAYALKNRGKLTGVYGHKAISLRFGGYYRGGRKIDKKVVKEAINAWEWASSHPDEDITHGADHWENVTAFGTPKWAHGMWVTLIIGNHHFFKEVGK